MFVDRAAVVLLDQLVRRDLDILFVAGFQRGFADIGTHNGCPLGSERKCNGTAIAGTCSGDNGNLPGESGGHVWILPWSDRIRDLMLCATST